MSNQNKLQPERGLNDPAMRKFLGESDAQIAASEANRRATDAQKALKFADRQAHAEELAKKRRTLRDVGLGVGGTVLTLAAAHSGMFDDSSVAKTMHKQDAHNQEMNIANNPQLGNRVEIQEMGDGPTKVTVHVRPSETEAPK